MGFKNTFLSARKADLKKGFQHLVVVLVLVLVLVVVGTQVGFSVRY
jgi:t-SNARE complex subunit (syntaxin)